MTRIYEPELGQVVFGQPYQKYDVDYWLESAITAIRHYLVATKDNDFADPFSNSGGDFTCDAFEVQAYNWNDEVDQPYNFKWRDLQVSWYKYFGRGMSANRKVKRGELLKMVDECIDAIRAAKSVAS
jgi:hypothetical protein